MLGTLSIPELIWLAFGVAALLFNLRALSFAVEDKRWLKANGLNGIREIVANGQIYEEAAVVAKDLVVVGIGVMAALVPSRADQQFSWVAFVTAAGLIFIVLVNMIASVVRIQTRGQLYRRVAQQDRARAKALEEG